MKTDQDPAPKLHAVPPNGERWHCPDPYATELAAAREGGRAYLAHLSAAIGVFLTTGDPANVVAMLADLWKAAAALATDEVALASWGKIDAQLEAHRATLRERAIASLRHKRQVTAERASLAMEIVTQAMKGGMSEEGAFRLLDRVATPLWRVAPDENGDHVMPEGEREAKPGDIVMALIDQARKWVEGKLKAEAEAADAQAKAMEAMAAHGFPLQPIDIAHAHQHAARPADLREMSVPWVLKLVAAGAFAYDVAPDAKDGKMPSPIVHPEVWARVEPLLVQIGAAIEVLGGGSVVQTPASDAARAGSDAAQEAEIFGELMPYVKSLRDAVAAGSMNAGEVADAIIMGGRRAGEVFAKEISRRKPLVVWLYQDGAYNAVLDAVLPMVGPTFRDDVLRALAERKAVAL